MTNDQNVEITQLKTAAATISDVQAQNAELTKSVDAMKSALTHAATTADLRGRNATLSSTIDTLRGDLWLAMALPVTTACLSQSACHRLLVTVCMSPPACHHRLISPLPTCLYQLPSLASKARILTAPRLRETPCGTMRGSSSPVLYLSWRVWAQPPSGAI
ncbi:hypothetical protein V502_05882 [Pseudogymnoascus sp. VKM F-4520 (FW-2644)]|nr:hypothetical protein V502_05882 [Pseudogymnoascus sp. VKM F-4520 (FW-2644)]